MYDYEHNLLRWLDNYVTRQFSERMDNRGYDETVIDTVLNEKLKRYVKNNSLVSIINQVPSDLLVWTLEHQLAVAEWVQRICLGNETNKLNELQKVGHFKQFIWLVASVLADFEQSNLQERPEFKTLEELLRFLRNEFSQSFPLDYQICEAKIAHKANLPNEESRPECSECGSTEVNSYGLRWQCKSCGRTWLKNPRRTRNND